MAKDKKSSKASAPKPQTSKPIENVKAGRVTKGAKGAAKEVAKKVEKGAKKAKKELTPESSDEEDDSTSASSDSSAESESEAETKTKSTKAKPTTNGNAKAGAAKDSSDSSDESSASDSDDSSSASDSEEEAAPKKASKAAEPSKKAAASKKAAPAKAKDESSSDSDTGSDSSSSDDDEEDAPKVNGAAKAKDASSDASSSSEEDSDEEEEEAPKVENKKRKAEEAIATQTPKKIKATVNGEEKEATNNLFVGNLSWNVDEEWLTREFEEFGSLQGVRVITDRDSGRSKGFGYVEFVETGDAAAALEAKNGFEVDGRNIRVDFSTGRQQRSDGNTPQQRSFDRAQKYGDTPNQPSATLFVGNISFNADESMLTEAFQDFGSIKGIRLPTDKFTGDFKGFGYVEMGSIDEATSAFEGLQGHDIGGRPIRLDYSTPKPNNDSPRGGFGGGRGGGRGRGGDRGGRGGGRGGFGDRGGRGGRGGSRGGGSFNRGGFGDFSGKKTSFD